MKSSWTEDYILKSVFMIFIGMEDYLSFNKNNPTADGSAQTAFVVSVTTQLKRNIEVSTFHLKLMGKLVNTASYYLLL